MLGLKKWVGTWKSRDLKGPFLWMVWEKCAPNLETYRLRASPRDSIHTAWGILRHAAAKGTRFPKVHRKDMESNLKHLSVTELPLLSRIFFKTWPSCLLKKCLRLRWKTSWRSDHWDADTGFGLTSPVLVSSFFKIRVKVCLTWDVNKQGIQKSGEK